MFENRAIIMQLHPWYHRLIMFLSFIGGALLIPIIEAKLKTMTAMPYDILYTISAYLISYLLAMFILPELGCIAVRKLTEPAR